MNRKYLALIPLLLATGCNNDIGDFDFSIHADPVLTHAPGIVSFELTRDDGESVQDCQGDWDFGDGITLGGTNEAEHRYTKAGKFDVSVKLTCGSQKASSSTNIEVFETVDLAVGALEARPLDVSTDGSLNVSFQVSNETTSILRVPTYIDIYVSPSSLEGGYQESGSIRVFRHTLQSLGAFGDQDAISRIELSIPMSASIRTGSYYVWAVANPDGNIGETSTSNNAVVSNQPITIRNQMTDGADFTPKSFSVSPSRTSVLTSATAQFTVLNQGSTTAETFHYEIWIGARDNSDNMDGAKKVHDSVIDGGISGIEQSIRDVMFSVTPAVSEPGFYYFWLILDPDDTIIERDETNNRIRCDSPIVVTNEPVLDADIIVNKVSFTPSTSTPGGTFSTKLTLFNQGTQQTGSFICTILLSEDMSLDLSTDHVVGSVNVDDLLAQETREITVSVEADTGIAKGKYWVFVFCDSSGVVTEANEDNNFHSSDEQIMITSTSEVDIMWGNVSATTSGKNLNMTAKLCNHGTGSIGPFQVSLSRLNLCNDIQSEIKRIIIDGLEAEECIDLDIQESMSCDFWCPSYQLSMTADIAQVIQESNEDNNTHILSENISLEGEDCVCPIDKYEKNDITSTATDTDGLNDDLTICRDDIDIFKLNVTDGGGFDVHVNHDSKRSQLKIELVRDSEIIDSFGNGDDLYLSAGGLTQTGETPVYLRISGADVIDANKYHVDMNIYNEITGIDIMPSGLKIDGGGLNSSEIRNVTVSLSNLGTSSAGPFKAGFYVSQTPNLDETSWRLSQQNVLSLPAGTSTVLTMPMRLPEDTQGGTYHLIVKADDEDVLKDVRKGNNISRTDAWKYDRSCWDVLDPNESFENPRKLSFKNNLFTQGNLAVCQSNPDFYAFDIKNGSSLDIAVTRTSSGDFDIFLYDYMGNLIASSRTTAATETIHRDIVVGDQTMFLEVRLLENVYNSAELRYDLSIKTEKSSAWLSCIDTFEPNDFPSSAYDLRSAAQTGTETSICPTSDHDYYSIELTEGDRLQIGFDTDSTLLRASLNKIDPETGQEGFIAMLTNLATQTFDYTAVDGDGTYTIHVFINASSGSEQVYRLKWLAEEGADVSVTGLKVATQTPYSGQFVEVSFNINNIGKGEANCQYDISFNNSLETILLWNDDIRLPEGESTVIRKKVQIPMNYVGDGSIVVTLTMPDDISLNNNSLSQKMTVTEACENDSNEPNDNILQATAFDDSISGTICPGDDDWFRVTLTSLSTVRLSFVHSQGDLALYAYDEQGKFIGVSDTASDEESIMLDKGKYYILVKGATSEVSNTYTLTVE